MEYRTLGTSDLQLSAIIYGAFAIGGNMWGGNEEKDSIHAVQASIEHGVTTLDTAPFYGFGLSEEMIGKAIKGYDRSKIQLLTKFGLVWNGSNEGKGEFFFDAERDGSSVPVYKYAAKESIIKEVEASLRRLETDYIDLLQIHWPDSTTPIRDNGSLGRTDSARQDTGGRRQQLQRGADGRSRKVLECGKQPSRLQHAEP